PPAIATTTSGAHAPGLLFTTVFQNAGGQQGAEIYDDTGQPVWYQPAPTPSYVHPITYRGQPALVYYKATVGSAAPGASQGEWIVLNTSYQEIARIRANNGYLADLHELQLSPDGTKAVMDIYNPVRLDMTPYGGTVDSSVTEGVIQEVDLATGAVTFEWHSLAPGNIPVTDSEVGWGPDWDYMHINSIEYDTDGNFLFSGRITSAVYKVNRSTGALMWLMGGKRNQFTFTDGDGGPSWPHDVRRRPDGTISVFDNGVGRSPQYSRGVVWQVDETAKTAHVTAQWRETPDLYGNITGNNTLLPNGDEFISWGNTGRAIEYQGQTPVWESQMSTIDFPYRTVRVDGWHATPAAPPDMALDRGATGVAAYASWNGATDVASWELWGGPDWSHMQRLTTVPKVGFETAMLAAAPATDGVFQVRALDASGTTLGISANTPDPITAKYQALGGASSFLGAPSGNGEYLAGSAGLAEDFAGGTIYWSAATGAHEVHGDIRDRYNALGGAGGFLGLPTSDETAVSDGRGRFNSFQGGAIYWTSTTGAHEVHGAFGFVWSVLGGTKSVLGYPATDSQTAADGVGQDQWFETGAIYSSPSTGIFEVHGGDVLVWASMGAEQGSFGYPISNTVTASDGSQVTFFQHGWIQYFPSTNQSKYGFY
ncbi:MAG: aryl-sulfate sulfotransferase, partial [Mycobacterium sp.]|nr:aryl-sulfate sulfotransferase [Mycobacterium sp.]